MNRDLEPLDPRTAIEMYLNSRRAELADQTLQSHAYRLKQFALWCDDQGIDNLNDVSTRDVHNFRIKRRDGDDLATATMRGQLFTLKKFLEFCHSIDAVSPGLSERVIIPSTTSDDVRDEMIEAERIGEILDYLEMYQYASLEHAFLETLWNTGMRIGAARGLDIEDYDSDKQFLEINHRPDKGTPLKNKVSGERVVSVSDRVTRVLNAWLAEKHTGIVDEFGRNPLFVTKRARLSRNRARSISYQYTRPCVYSKECPHNRRVDECEARPTSYSHKCPSALSPHAIRRGSITYHLIEDTPKQVVQDRMNASSKIIDRFYDQRTRHEKAEQRRDYLPD